MVKAIKKIGLLLFSASVIACLLFLGACSQKTTVTVGKYYLEGSDSVYIEILPDNKITFVGVDFTKDFERWEANGDDFDYEASVQGIKDYVFNEKEKALDVPVYSDGVITIYMIFSYGGNTLTRSGKNYILNSGNE